MSFEIVEGEGPIVATAIHDGHALRPEIAAAIELDAAARLREEDPFTGRLAAVAATHVIARGSRFEVDLNRPRDQAVYRGPNSAWGLRVWRAPLAEDVIQRSLEEYDRFYAALERVLRERERRHGRFLVLDVHSYNHRRDGADAEPAAADQNPEVNLGTGSLDHARFGRVAATFVAGLGKAAPFGAPLDVRENVKFRGGELSKWVHRTFPETGCCLAVEFKKTFMDEWTGAPDDARIATLANALAAILPSLEESLLR